jgi:uncharacterized protein (DUF305 family)
LFPGALAITLLGAAASADPAPSDTFTAAMQETMTRMDDAMMVAPSGDPDRDFAALMIPHHQGALDMALVELRFGKDRVLRRLAEAIIVEQQQEIDTMQRAIAALPPAPSSASMSMPMHSHR